MQALPDDMKHRIGSVARGQVVDTLVLVRAARLVDPARWRFDGDIEGAAYEGGEVGSTGWSVIAAESALMASCRPDSHIQVTEHHLAGAALTLPNSAASARLPRSWDMVEAALGISSGQLAEQMARTAKLPGAELLTRRVDDLVGGPVKRLTATNVELTPDRWRTFGRPTR